MNDIERAVIEELAPDKWAAAAVAAFLRALPDTSLPFDDGSGDTYIADYQLRMLAAAVEKAARDAD